MKPSLLEHLACPSCHGRFDLAASSSQGAEVMEGVLRCRDCRATYPVRRGVPRFAESAPTDEAARTAAAFGWEWRTFSRVDDHHEQQFLDWIAPAGRNTFRGQVVLEGGCGKGRHTRLASRYGAAAIIGVDLSDAVDTAFDNTRDEPTAHIVQADLLSLPLRPASCDYAFSVGVLHHLSNPSAGFRALSGAVRPGGAVSIWVYGAENNAWITNIVSPFRIGLTSRLPPRLLHALSFVVALPLWILLAAAYRPARSPRFAWTRRFLFYYPYLGYISVFPFREIHAIVHDHLTAPVAHYLRRDVVEQWYRSVGARDTVISWHNRNSWRGYGLMPAIPKAEAAGIRTP
ncbi:MAG TPA: methyltransferase domain-containing protein [Candidatus Dormibacteraeota bacterium]|nr:methyltransferase domain-containing protein [Candidatus Dormibacteraeota bacterium]